MFGSELGFGSITVCMPLYEIDIPDYRVGSTYVIRSTPSVHVTIQASGKP